MKTMHILILGTLLLLGCSKTTTSAIIDTSQKDAFGSYIEDQDRILNAYSVCRSRKNVSAFLQKAIDSIVKADIDTVFIIENVMPPSYGYHAQIWNKNEEWIVSTLNLEKSTGKYNMTDSANKALVEHWEIEAIMDLEHQKPYAYEEEAARYHLATRLIFKNKKCVKAETFAFELISFEEEEAAQNKAFLESLSKEHSSH